MRILKSIVLIHFQLQDIALIPNTTDSRLNTAECVSRVDSDSDSVNELIYAGIIECGISILQIIFSLIGSIIFGEMLMRKIQQYDQYRKSAFRFTAIVIVSFDFLLLLVTVVFGFLSCYKGMTCNGRIKLLLCEAFLIIGPVVVGISCDRRNETRSETKAKRERNEIDCCFYYPLCYGICYHLLWVVLGVFADPF